MRGRRAGGGRGRARSGRNSRASGRLPGLRWIPVPLAMLAAAVGWLVFGSLQGQSAANAANQTGFVASGLELNVQQMSWMSNDMTGDGPIKAPAGFTMPSSEMPGMQPVGDDRLQLDANIANITRGVQYYNFADFHLVAKNGQSYPIVNDGSDTYMTGPIEPDFSVNVAMYFDVPEQQVKGLSIEWSRGGATVDFPVSTTSAPTPHHH